MVAQPNRYTIIIKGHLGKPLQSAFSGMVCTSQPDGTTTIAGNLPDQAAVFGLLKTIERLSLTLIAIQSSADPFHVE